MLGLPKGSNPKQPIETEELRKKRGPSVSGSLAGGAGASPRRWVWTSLGFGEVIHPTKTQREEARAREIAASLAPPPSASPSPTSPTASSPASSSAAVPDAPPLAASPAAAAAAAKPAASPSKPAKQANTPSSLGLNQFLSLLQSKASDAAAVAVPPSIPPSQIVPASCVETHVAVHLLPHTSQPSGAAILFGASPAPTPNPPTVVYTAQSNAYPRIRVKVRTFFDLPSLIPKKKDGSSSSDDSNLNAASLSNALKSELKARKEKLEAEKAAKDRASMSASEQAKYDEAQKEKEKREKEEQEEKTRKEEARKNKPKPVGPPPQTMELEIDVNASLRSLVQQIVDFYQAYEVELDPDSIRLASCGKEITKCELPVLRPEDEKRVIQVREVNKQPAAQKEDRSQSQQNADRYQQQYYGGQGGSGQSILPRDAAAAISAASRLIREAMWHALNPGAAVFLGGAHHVQTSTQTDRERYFRNNTMLAECALTPTRESVAAVLASAEGSSMEPILPEFPLLMVYDDCSRFAFDATALPSDVTLTADALGATMLHADNKWVTLRANKSYSSGKHSWKVKMDRCQGGNTFLGVCTDKMPQNNYIGADANGYGYYGCGNIYRLGSSSAYGQSYRTGDIMTVHLDMDKRTLSFDKNDSPLGVAFSDLPDKVYPAFSLYTRNDHIQLIEFGQ